MSQVHSIHIENNQIRGNCTEPGGEGAQVAITTDAHDITLRLGDARVVPAGSIAVSRERLNSDARLDPRSRLPST